MLKVNEIYLSIQGESTYTGLPCVFIRLTGCNLRCTYCDTEYAFYNGNERSVDEIIDKVRKYNCKLVEITGGEPLIQDESIELIIKLCDNDFTVMLETAGNMPIKNVDERVTIIMDLKCPSSAMMDKNLYDNVEHLKKDDEIKFVIGNREDYDWMKEIICKYDLQIKCKLLASVVFGTLE
ncbi:MAG: radical SAM protein, partial [Ignavibacteriaceae bacterium]|nr:radical SAM protein [Ignavibacteriaceae bacterium]